MSLVSTKMEAVIHGEPVGKSGGWEVAWQFGQATPRIVLTKKGKAYKKAVAWQARQLDPMLRGRLAFRAMLYYVSERPDLDPSLLLDALQGIWYVNDRQVREMHVFHGIDKVNPRAEVRVWEIGGE